jgi:Uma2 family endonuclease
MLWSDVLADETLKDLPYKIELDEWGRIIMTPASNRHGLVQSRISHALRNHFPAGEVIVECSIQTRKGVRVADVAWCSDAFLARHGDETPFAVAPELCVEVLSPSNTRAEMDQKRTLYFESGAQEVWIVREGGGVERYAVHGPVAASRFGKVPGIA